MSLRPRNPGWPLPNTAVCHPKNRELTGKWRFPSLECRDGAGAGSRNAQGGMLEAGRDAVGEGWDPAPQRPNSATLIPKEGAPRSFLSSTRDNAAGENRITQTPGGAAN